MIIELVFALVLGVVAGNIIGLIPGMHTNSISAFILSISPFLLLHFPPFLIILFIVSMAASHLVTEFIPSIFLGAPDESALSVLPGHELLLEGKGYEAFIHSLLGVLSSIPLLIIMIPVFFLALPKLYFYLRPVMLIILVLASLYLIIRNEKKILALVIFLMAGFLGISSLTLPIKQQLLPLLTGLFGASTLLTSITKKQKIPEQSLKVDIDKKEIKDSILASLLASPLCSFLPALGSSQAGVIGSDMIKSKKGFLVLIGSVNSLVLGLSFLVLFILGDSRTGVAAATHSLSSISSSNIFIIILFFILALILASVSSIFIARAFAKKINKVNYSLLSAAVLIFLTILVFFTSGPLGILLFAISCLTGLIPIFLGVKRTVLMGCLMVPSILLYLPF